LMTMPNYKKRTKTGSNHTDTKTAKNF